MSHWGYEIRVVVLLGWLGVVVVVSFVVLVLHLSTTLIRICFLWGHDLLLWFYMHRKGLSMRGDTRRR